MSTHNVYNSGVKRMLEATARAEDRHFWFRGLRRNARFLLEQAAGTDGISLIVDCGSGTGRNLDWLASFARAVGVELSWTGLDEARRARRPVARATVTQLPFADGVADVATSFDVLYCLPDDSERAAVREMWRILKPGGIVLINVAALDVLRGSHSALTMEVRRYTRKRLRDLLTREGFAVERMTFTNLPIFPATLAVRVADRVTGRAPEGSDADLRVPPAPVNALFDAALRCESLLLRAIDMPLGTSILCVARKSSC
jgi:SAM-dependent methyltransferase